MQLLINLLPLLLVSPLRLDLNFICADKLPSISEFFIIHFYRSSIFEPSRWAISISTLLSFPLRNELSIERSRRRTGESWNGHKFRDRVAHMEKVMLKKLLDSRSFEWISLQDRLDHVFGLSRNSNVFRKWICIHSDSLISWLDIVGLKRRFSNQESIGYDTQGPDVHFIGMASLSF